LMFELYGDHVDLVPLGADGLKSSPAPDVLAGLTEDANKRANKSVGRTFIGIDDRDGNGIFETVLVLNTLSAKQEDVAKVLREFGADKVMMLDGGGSAQLICQGKPYVPSERLIPQALAFVAGAPQPMAAIVSAAPDWPVVVQGQPLDIQFALQNAGTQSWQAGSAAVVIKTGELWSQKQLPLAQDVLPEANVVLTFTVSAIPKSGIQSVVIHWQIEQDGQSFEGDAIQFETIVLPVNLTAQKTEFQRTLDQWKIENPADVRSRTQEWLDQRSPAMILDKARPLLADLGGILWIPAVILPVSMLLLAAILKIQQDRR
jgi:hypothetical protein